MISNPDNDNNLEEPMIFIIIGKGYESDKKKGVSLHVLLKAADDDSAVRGALNALAEEGFAEADLDQIGLLQDAPEDEPHASAYKDAVAGEIAIIRFDG
ncbi:transcriptional regulator [Oryzifoliimicrobium ureilyticus]|uniref:transcriptional regulator n=1 Tax=Oryzifoliimicrobium ureilyticus TaxID=3113724 RepID=UPI003075FAD1